MTRLLIGAAALTLLSAAAHAFAPGGPSPGAPVSFVACAERTAGGSWVATDPDSGYTYSLLGARAPANVVIQVVGVVSSAPSPAPGWALAPIKIVVGRQPCASAGVLQHVEGGFGVGPAWFGYGPVVRPAVTKD